MRPIARRERDVRRQVLTNTHVTSWVAVVAKPGTGLEDGDSLGQTAHIRWRLDTRWIKEALQQRSR